MRYMTSHKVEAVRDSIAPRARKLFGLFMPIIILSVAFRQDAHAENTPYEVAFKPRELMVDKNLAPLGNPAGQLSISGDGKYAAYQVRFPLERSIMAGRAMENSPDYMAGTRVLVSSVDGVGSPIDVGPKQEGVCWRPSWSPDNRRLAFYCDVGDGNRLWIYEVQGKKSRQVGSANVRVGVYPGDEPQWSPDSRTVYIPKAPPRPVEASYEISPAAAKLPRVKVFASGGEKKAGSIGVSDPVSIADEIALDHLRCALISVDVETGEEVVLIDESAIPGVEFIRVSPSGQWISYLSVPTRKRGAHHNEWTLSKSLVIASRDGKIVNVVADDLHIDSEMMTTYLHYQWHPTEDRFVLWRNGELWLYDVNISGPKTPRRLAPDSGYLASSLYHFTRDGGAVVVGIDPIANGGIANREFTDRSIPRGLAVVPLTGEGSVSIRFDTDKWSYVDTIKADERTVWQPSTDTLTFLLREQHTGETAIFRFDLRSRESEQLWKGMAKISSFAAGVKHNFIVGKYSDYETPEDLYRFGADFSRKQRVTHVEPRLDSVTRGTAHVIETVVPLHDGTLSSVRSVILLPPGAKRGDKLPAIVMAYPGLDLGSQAIVEFLGGAYGNTVPNMIFTSAGYAVLLTHVKLDKFDRPGNEFKESIDALLPQVYNAANQGYIDERRLALSGQSGGGYMTAAMVSRTNLFRAAIPVAGEYDLASTVYSGQLASSRNTADSVGSIENSFRLAQPPWSNFMRWFENTPYYQLDKIETPLLIVHGTADASAPVQDAWVFFNGLYRLGKSAQIAEYEGEDHVIYLWSLENCIDVSKRMLQFLGTHLGEPREIQP